MVTGAALTKIANDLQISNSLHFDTAQVLLLGVGGVHGSDYKLRIVERLREIVSKLVVVEIEEHWADDYLRSAVGVDGTILCPSSYDLNRQAQFVLHEIEEMGFSPDAVITYRQEWLGLRAFLAQHLGISGPSTSAVEVSSNKFMTKQLLHSIGMNVPFFDVVSLNSLLECDSIHNYPVFIRPNVGIRSEWARAIYDQEGIQEYARDIELREAFHLSDQFLVESLLVGHEVDVDLFLHNGAVLYGKSSDNFPARYPFALETGHLMPSILPREVQRELVDVASRASLACGFQDGNIHAELMVLPDKRVFVLEINGRLGGMYIAEWHRRIWGVDLVVAELATSLKQSPAEFLQERDPDIALAQVCLTAPLPDTRVPRSRSVFFDPAQYQDRSHKNILLECWYPDGQDETLAISGPLNLGALTVSGKSPLAAFRNLLDIARQHPMHVTVDGESHAVDLAALNCFSAASPACRFTFRPLQSSDTPWLLSLLTLLTPRATFNPNTGPGFTPDPSTIVLCAVDEFDSDRRVVGMISIHFWRRARSGPSLCAYLHDLIVSPEYRRIGIAHQLLNAAVALAKDRGCYKTHLDCDSSLKAIYEAHGFERVADCMVQYFD